MTSKTLLGATVLALAFATAGVAANPQGEHGHGMPMMQDLNLTDEQKAQIQAIHEQAQAAVRAVLTEEQRAQLDARRAERMERMEERREHRAHREERRRDRRDN